MSSLKLLQTTVAGTLCPVIHMGTYQGYARTTVVLPAMDNVSSAHGTRV